VLGETEMRELGMGALLGVSQGSAREARLLALKWNGAGAGDPAWRWSARA
jgi:leucyl aminopeptidase